MDLAELPTPNPRAITEVSPSLANQLLSCPLRSGFARDPEHRRWRRPSTASELGVVAHAVTEAAFRRGAWPDDPASARAALEELWDDEVERAAGRLASAWAPATPPAPTEWSGYALTRVRTLKRATALVTGAKAPARAGHRIGVELEMRDQASGLFGRADRIEWDGTSARVVDLKTGLHQDEPTDSQRRQLLLYAVLVQRSTGTWPASIDVEDASGKRFSQPLDPEEAEQTLAEVLRAVADFNEAIADGTLAARAAPDPERCRWCEFRVVCAPFWAALAEDWGHRAVLGVIEERGQVDDGAHLTISVESPSDAAGSAFHVSGLPGAPPADARGIAITDWQGPADAHDVRARWSTRIRTW